MLTGSVGGTAGRTIFTAVLAVATLACQAPARAQTDPADAVCARFAAGSPLPAPPDLFASNHLLEVTLTLKTVTDAQGLVRYCYVTPAGLEAPTLHVSPGDQLVIHLKNALPGPAPAPPPPGSPDCMADAMGPATTNLHFHGMNLPPTCHQDDVLSVLLQPTQTFDYSVRIPADEPPGVYWYHPHPHGYSHQQVLGGAAGALIVDGIETVNPAVAGLAQRVLVLRDQPRVLPSGSLAPGEPTFDLSVNFVPVTYPQYAAPVLQTAPSAREFWRVLNASSDEILDLEYRVGGVAQPLEIVAIDGIPVGQGTGNIRTLMETHVLLPAGGRVELIVTTPSAGMQGELRTRAVDAGIGALPYPERPLATVAPASTMAAAPAPAVLRHARAAGPRPLRFAALAAATPDAQRRLFFSESIDAQHNASFYITLDGQTPKTFDMSAPPDLVLHQGTVEDWTIENRSVEDHVFHIHQLHFQVMAVDRVAVSDPALRDTVSVPHWDGSGPYHSVTLRMDFRDPAIVGTFVYHCHILSHEDQGMMAALKLLPAGVATRTVLTLSAASVNVYTPLTLTATVTPAGNTPVTGSVQFMLDGVPLGAPVTVANGKASLEASVSASGAHALTAAYSGDSDCNESLSAPVGVTVADFSLSAPAISIPSGGGSGTTSVTVTGTSGFDSAVALACTLPEAFAGGHCSLAPASLTGSGSTMLTVTTSSMSARAAGFGGTILAGFGFQLVRGHRRSAAAGRDAPAGQRRRRLRLAWLVLPFTALACSPGGSNFPGGTPPGTYAVTVSGTATQAGASLVRTVSIPVEVH